MGINTSSLTPSPSHLHTWYPLSFQSLQAWAVQIVQHYTLENKQEPNALRYSRTVIFPCLVCTRGKGNNLLTGVLLILAEIRGRCDEICWILYESTFHIFGRMKPHLSDVHSLETLLNEPRFHSDYGVCIPLNLALEIHQVPCKVVSHGGPCLTSLPRLSLLCPFSSSFPYPPFLSSLPFFSCFT